ncbi:MAG: ABC transporter ATP-binding protein [Elusimicrobia bacterium]|nr:ABC transporter ATP-binding protein [Elusimicrobiota bacterium]
MTPLVKSLLDYIKPYKARLFQAMLSMTALAMVKGAIVYILGPIIDNIFIKKNLQMLYLVIIALPVIFALRFVLEYINWYLMSWIGQKVVQKIRHDLFVHVHRLSIEFYWRMRSSDVISRVINDLTNVQNAVQFVPVYMIRDAFTIIAIMFVLFYINWKFALISMAIIPLASVIIKILSEKMRRSSVESQAVMSEISHKFQENLQGIIVVKAFNYEEESINKFTRTNDDFFAKIMRYLRAAAISSPLMEFVGGMILIVMIYLGGMEVFSGKMTTGMFMSFIASFFTAYLPIKNIANLNSRIQMGIASWERIYQVLREKPSVAVPVQGKRIVKLSGSIEFRNVSYRYPAGRDFVLRNLSFRIEPGEVAAFVGPSGSGKTTIIHLCLRFFDPVEGDIFFDGINLRELDIRDLRSHLGLVTQDTILFDDTVSKNIIIGKPDASKEEIAAAAKAADSNDFITDLPQGYDTVLGERGLRLSGGQRQRLAIARAMVKKPAALLLDEATSNLDAESEKTVQSAIEKILSGRTVVMVAHRLSTVKKADRIFVLSRGEIAESGPHEELMKMDGVYRKLYEVAG